MKSRMAEDASRFSASQTDWRSYAEKVAKESPNVGMSRNPSDNNATLQNRGLFDYQKLLNDFYGYQPKEDDTEGRMLKLSFQTNAIQSVMDTEMAKSLASHTTANAIDLQNATADAELRNKLTMNDQEYNFGMQKLGYESDLLMRDRGGSSRDLQQDASDQNIAQMKQSGENDLANIGAQGNVDVNKIGAQGKVDVANIQATGSEERKGQDNAQQLKNKTSEQNRSRAASLARSF